VRAANGDRRVYPVAENVHEAGILRTTLVPAAIEPVIAERAQAIAIAAVEALNDVGVFCVELFVMPDNALVINEIAPRPHNSGHYTLDACTVSQFEQQVRALCGLPLGEARLLSPAAMINLIGEDLPRVHSEEALIPLLGVPGSKLHIYGKKSVRPGRKMGHVTFLAEQAGRALNHVVSLQQSLSGVKQS
jgi:5-(carboxyamino)imidazole ribonucleotide synthase